MQEYYENIGFTYGDTYKYIKIPFKNNYIEIKHFGEKNKEEIECSSIFETYVSEFNISKNIEKEISLIYKPLDLIPYDNIVSIDDSSFNEKYNLLCEEEHLAVRMFTSDILCKIMELHSKYRIIVNTSIIGSKIYMESRKEECMEYKYIDRERENEDIQFIKEMADILYEMVEEFEE